MAADRTPVLDHLQVQRKLRRIAHQLHEEHHQSKSILLVGIAPRGALLAERLAHILRDISALKVDLATITLDKNAPLQHEPVLSIPLDRLKDRVVVLVDDVLMSGRTLMHAAALLVRVPLQRLTTVVLVDRWHRRYPIRADIVGLTLSTTLQEHITVDLGQEDTVYLS